MAVLPILVSRTEVPTKRRLTLADFSLIAPFEPYQTDRQLANRVESSRTIVVAGEN